VFRVADSAWLRSVLRAASCCLLLAGLGAAQAGPVLDRIKARGSIVIAHRDASVPFSYLDADKKPVGYALDLCARLTEAIRVKLGMPALKTQYELVTSSSRIPAIVEGRADLECGSTTNNAERRKQVAFTVPHYIAGARYLMRADAGISELSQFAGKKLVSTQGSTPLASVRKANQDSSLRIEVLEAPDHATAYGMVAGGQADGFAMDDVLLYGLMASRGDAANYKVVGKFLTIEPLAIMFSKDDADLKRLLDGEMRRMILDSREAFTLFNRWFGTPIPPRGVALNLPMNYLLRDFWKYPSDWVPN
jgi:ABC-type amino acid transport substrate-binding protein